MQWRWLLLLGCVWYSVTPAMAQLYRWTDKKGTTHITDNPAAVPPAYRAQAGVPPLGPVQPPPDAEPPPADTAAPKEAPEPQAPPQDTPAPARAPSQATTPPPVDPALLAAQKERADYLEQLRATRPIQTNPLLVRQRRQIGVLTRALVEVEQRIDALTATAQRVPDAPATSAAKRDQEGHDVTYWQQRVAAPRQRLRQAQSQRQATLRQLMDLIEDTQRGPERQGREVLQYVDALIQAEAEIDAADKAIAAVTEDALRVNAPLAWLR